MITPKEITAIRERVGSRVKLAAMLGVASERTIARWEAGENVPHQICEDKLREIEKAIP